MREHKDTAVSEVMAPEDKAMSRLEMLKLAFDIEDSASQRMVHYIDTSATSNLGRGKSDDYLEAAKTKFVDANGDYWVPCAENDRRSEVVVMPGRITLEHVLNTAVALRGFIEGK